MTTANSSSFDERHFWPLVVIISFVAGALDVMLSTFRSIWSDEAFTAIASTMRFHDFAHLVLHKEDAVNATYDLVMRPYMAVTGHGLTAMRLPSAVFMMIACVGIMMIARALVGARTAILTGIIFALMPLIGGFGSEARSYALSVAAVTWSTWFFLRFLYDRDHSRRWGWLYGLSLVVTGYVFLYATLIIVVHITIAAFDSDTRRRIGTLLSIQGVAFLLIIPVILFSWSEHQEIAWIPSGFSAMRANGVGVFTAPFWPGMGTSTYPHILALLAWMIIVWGLVKLIRQPDLSKETLVAIRLGLAWGLLPGILLSFASLVGPYFTLRYVVFCAPAIALLLAMTIARIPRKSLSLVVVVMLAALVVLSDRPLYSNTGKDGWGTAVQVLASRGAPGEYVLPTPQGAGDNFVLDARVSGLPHDMTLIDFGQSLAWTTSISIPHQLSKATPSTHVIWLVPRFGVVGCAELKTLLKWGFGARAQYGSPTSPTYEFVSPPPSTVSSLFMKCTS